MGSRLRKAKKDNKGIGGKGAGKLTDKLISELSLYYGLAIRRNPDSVEEMKRDVWATYFHKISTNEYPQHMNCSSSWCKYQKAIEDGTIDEFDHKNPPLNDKVLEVIKPIYESLSADSLLERCLGSETQNNNESLNSLIWTFAPKHIHAGPKTIEIATFFAVSIFNEGFIPILKILDVMGIAIGPEANAFKARRDEARIERSELRTSEASKEGRTARLHKRTSENEHFEVEEDFLYGAGIAD
ncbi:uncharacterized protein LOC123258566 [Cotesia glomerata]|uniref:uncharacterized protein LOC123258566 n=1 Tax=Cotesia glomerata TaxID=32391 RepID=UPI001D03503D|nr:uncharacterized protein LOC123258566 [Cotesia glomerata]